MEKEFIEIFREALEVLENVAGNAHPHDQPRVSALRKQFDKLCPKPKEQKPAK